ncbi:type II secretion system protein XpsI [Xanthomonas vesicatoria]|uniref:Type II secretory pathway pseudopilin n=1 Tax=Xanthomonas vesicatoria ATCC 35937 TaxID=925775 RepID=F0B7W1_9XANT|nr:prepilin-type N-terminal cleavage/methylation domain-containing protein [Xanthomonas vesicatoria]APP76563.1 general secretion pathway protein GspI [Xanthomonas vesicatoria ATCC 35937]EGD11486.1 type II secretory pathway pseudopilin [Xanthomonas vesicatoria ATCC 35937]KTF35444.1 general secretion pathway protein GspI [Xanthomonas vesicatoria]MCC8597119.1 prepilin-type N-terminal cleavage/methylation domain-containing protein [Xanthomonas vesicatoria]MCC8605496.1 prepilin-type N-terminal clea
MKRQRGYTLIEVIVAFALLALALSLLLGSLSGAARQVRAADDSTRATLHAQSLLAVQGMDKPLVPEQQQGTFENGHFRWSMDVRPYDEPRRNPQAPVPPGAHKLLQLTLVVRWGEAPNQMLQWRTLRLVAATAQDSAL